MKDLNKIFLIKTILTSNVYLIVFFKLLTSNGITQEQIIYAISLGTFFMIFGDAISSFLVDKFGPKRIVMIGSLLQAVAVFLLVFCTTLNQLMV
ncbi:MFS transporter, partial [Tenacibaculum finnmarkense]